jgi:multiple sugar transport system substrate-binding protein
LNHGCSCPNVCSRHRGNPPDATFNDGSAGQEYYFYGGSYVPAAQSIQPPQVLAEPLRLAGGLRVLVHGDPTFMVMENLKRQFEQIVGCRHSPAGLLDRPAAPGGAEERRTQGSAMTSSPWICPGSASSPTKGVLMPLDEVMDIDAWIRRFPHGRLEAPRIGADAPMACRAQTTPELLFYRKDSSRSRHGGRRQPPTTSSRRSKIATTRPGGGTE